MSETMHNNSKPRLKFIDLARAIAILLMLEGHFVGMVLGKEYRDDSSAIYNAWNFVRGFTAPLFFTVAGMIFAYLLSGETEGQFFKRVRVRKGFKRALELLFWGYVLQLSVRNIGGYFRGDFETWVFAFHVLQCIGVGLIALLVIAAILDYLPGRGSLIWPYSWATILCIYFYLHLKNVPEGTYLPDGWPQIFQNMVRGPRTVFPVAPWLGFTFLGGVIGVTVRKYGEHMQSLKSCLWFFALAGALMLVWLAAGTVFLSAGLAWFAERAAEVVAFLGLLRLIELKFGIGMPRMLCVGRMTFEIYIVHVVILYGGIFGMGLDGWLSKALNPWQAAFGAAVFLTAFFWFAQAVDAWYIRKRA